MATLPQSLQNLFLDNFFSQFVVDDNFSQSVVHDIICKFLSGFFFNLNFFPGQKVPELVVSGRNGLVYYRGQSGLDAGVIGVIEVVNLTMVGGQSRVQLEFSRESA